jgi:molybdenum cofactor guanylyltransferase
MNKRQQSGATRGVVGVVLAGGRSSRMGTDKALIDIGGRRLVETAVASLVESGVATILVIGGTDSWPVAVQQALISSNPSAAVSFVPDAHPGEGPLGGIVTAADVLATGPLADNGLQAMMVLPCDIPFPDVDLVTILIERVLTGPASTDDVGSRVDGATISVGGHVMAVFGCYRLSLIDAAKAAFGQGERRIRALIGCGDVVVMELTATDSPIDLDTPEDLAKWMNRRSGKT